MYPHVYVPKEVISAVEFEHNIANFCRERPTIGVCRAKPARDLAWGYVAGWMLLSDFQPVLGRRWDTQSSPNETLFTQ